MWPALSRGGNPFVDLFADALRAAGATVLDVTEPAAIDPALIDVLHVHWPEQVFWMGGGARAVVRRLWRTVRALHRLRRAGVVVVWMVHNLQPHDFPRERLALWIAYRRLLCAACDGFMTLSPGTVDTVRHAIPRLARKPVCAVWLPLYPHVQAAPDPRTVRAGLDVAGGARLYGFLGLLRPYKGIEQLIEAFAALADPGARLVIAGEPLRADYAAALSALCVPDRRVRLIARHLGAEEFAAYQRAVDVTVLPFRGYLHSSSIVHAVCEHSPVLTPGTPFARSVGDEVGEGWITTYERPLRAGHLLACVRPPRPPRLAAFAPSRLGALTLPFYAGLRAAREGRR